MEFKVYIAGKVSKDSVFGKHHWRDEFLLELESKTGHKFINLDPLKDDVGITQNQSQLIYGKDCSLISKANFVIVNLTNDISVGGSQETLIAKYFGKPLIGIAPKEGKFNKSEKEFMGEIWIDWIDPFVTETCDYLFESIDELAKYLKVDKFKSKRTLTEIIEQSMIEYDKINTNK